MVDPKFYSTQYSAMMAAADRAVTFIEQGHSGEAKTLLERTLLAAEEAYIQACEEEPHP